MPLFFYHLPHPLLLSDLFLSFIRSIRIRCDGEWSLEVYLQLEKSLTHLNKHTLYR